MLLLSGWLSGWFALPAELLRLIGLVNLAYGAFSFSLAVRSRRPPFLIALLAAANAAWAFVCFAMAAKFATTASPFGLAQLIGEGIIVGGLAWMEWSRRARLVKRA